MLLGAAQAPDDMGDQFDQVDPATLRARLRTPSPAKTTVDVARAADTESPELNAVLALQRLAGNASVNQLLQRAPEDEEVEEPGELEAGAARSPVHDVVGRGGGSPLPEGLRTEMEARLGADFGGVRVHTDAAATASAESVGAHAYTVGNDVVFRADQWDPGRAAGRRTLAHELTHVVQQASGDVEGRDAPGGIRVSSPGDRFERAADRAADAAMAAPAPAASAGRSLSAGAATAQREEAPEEEVPEELEAHGRMAIQRQALSAEGNRPGPPTEEELGEGDEIAPPDQAPSPGPEEMQDEEEQRKQQQGG